MMRPEPLPIALVDSALDLVQRKTGLVFLAPRRTTFEGALHLCMRRAGASELGAYLQRLSGDSALFDELAGEITVGETYFLRDVGQWDLVRARILPELLQAHGSRPLRLWSAGCASGEEAYSMAIALHQIGAGGRGAILGTDLSQAALARARRAEYGAWALRNVPEEVVGHYFERRGQRFDLSPWIRRQVEFRAHNLAGAADGAVGYGVGPMDLIMCRNVLIYLDGATVARVARGLLDSLSEDGCLLLGASDPMIGHVVRCDVEVTEAGLLYRKLRTGRGHVVAPPAIRPDPVAPSLAAPAAAPPAPTSVDRRAQLDRCYAERDYVASETLARELMAAGDGSPAVEIALVRSLANRGALVEAGRACAAALDAHQTNAELAYLHGVLLAQGGMMAESAEAFRRALYLDRTLIVAHLAMGDALARVGEPAGARRAFRSATRLLAELPLDAAVPASDGQPTARLAEMARSRLRLLDHSAA